jgi:hypothetical protein
VAGRDDSGQHKEASLGILLPEADNIQVGSARVEINGAAGAHGKIKELLSIGSDSHTYADCLSQSYMIQF